MGDMQVANAVCKCILSYSLSTTRSSLCYLGDPNSLIIKMDIPALSSLFIFCYIVDVDFFVAILCQD